MIRLRRRFSGLMRDERGASAVEFALLAPLILMVLLGTVTIFHMFRSAQNLEKATYTVGDILSRQTLVSSGVITNMLSLIIHTVPIASTGALRVTSVSKVSGTLKIDWSKEVGTLTSAGTTAIPLALVPDIANGDSVLLVETFVPYTPLVSGFGQDAFTFYYRAVQRPRFVGSIVFQD